jgi:hypothetical protein
MLLSPSSALDTVRPQKPLKVDLNNDYPCPCRRRGRLQPIVLTEAFGCDRCQQIFVLEDNGQVIEQLSSSYPYKRAWRWTGYHWIAIRPGLGSGFLSMVTGAVCLLMVGWLLLILRSPSSLSMILGIAIAVVLLSFFATLFWISYRR